ncbi:MAG: hypothetical protein K8F53_03505 [Rhodocyclaceae bacterium]|jgi:hypothetical protein|nr:hypothetical protein [Rhodocyclaceae bacterium]
MATISKESILKLFRKESCLDLRKLAARHSVDTDDAMLTKVVGNLERNGKIRRIGGIGRRAAFVLATFEG